MSVNPLKPPVVGDPVVVHTEDFESNGSKDHAGIVTRVWSGDMVNTMVFPDCGAPTPATSINKDRNASRYWYYPGETALPKVGE